MAQLCRTIPEDKVYISVRRSVHAKINIHTSKMTTTTRALIDCRATENFMDLSYARELGLPLTKLPRPRKLFNVDRTENIAGRLEYYMDAQLQTGQQQTMHRFYLSYLGNNNLILGYPWFASTQPNIDWARGWIDQSHLPITLRPAKATTRAQFRNYPLQGTIHHIYHVETQPTRQPQLRLPLKPHYKIPPEELIQIP
jgi:hypothetical protein